MTNAELDMGTNISEEVKNTSAYYYARDVRTFLISTITDETIISKCNDIVDRLIVVAKEMAEEANSSTDRYRELMDSSSSIYDDFLNIIRDYHGSSK